MPLKRVEQRTCAQWFAHACCRGKSRRGPREKKKKQITSRQHTPMTGERSTGSPDRSARVTRKVTPDAETPARKTRKGRRAHSRSAEFWRANAAMTTTSSVGYATPSSAENILSDGGVGKCEKIFAG